MSKTAIPRLRPTPTNDTDGRIPAPIRGRDYPVLALNADFTPIDVLDWRTSIGIVMREKAFVVEEYSRRIHSPSHSMAIPSVIALNRYADSYRQAPFTRRNLFLAYAERDEVGVFWRCALCGEIERHSDALSFEHLIPRSRGGDNSYRNIVLAHVGCNNRKGDRLLHEAGMHLHVRVKTPTEKDIVLARLKTGFQETPAEWMSFIDQAYWNVPLVD